MNPRIRGNLDFIFIFKTASDMQRKILHEEFGANLDFRSFSALIAQACRDFGCLVVDVHTNDPDPQKCYFKHTFQFPEPEFKIGSKEDWKKAEEEQHKEIAAASLKR